MKSNMKTNKVTDSLISEKYFRGVSPDAKKHLLSSLRNLSKLAPTTPTFKLYGKSNWSVVTDFLDSVSAKSGVPQWLIQYELSRKEKYGPQGGHAPWAELKENAEMYFSRPREAKVFATDTRHYETLNIKMLSAPDALRKLKKDNKIQTRAAGWRAFNLKKTDRTAQCMALQDIKSGEWRKGWAYFFSRYNKKKKRLFVPMPFSSMILQAQYFNPFLEAIQRDLRADKSKSPFTFWSDKLGFDFCFHTVLQDFVNDRVGSGPDTTSHLVYVMRDFEKMDTTMGPSQKENFFIPKLAKALHFSDTSENYMRMREIMLFSNYCPIATPDGMWFGAHGEASGATVTNGGETCGNETYNDVYNNELVRLCSAYNITFRVVCHFGNGDDGISIYYLDDTSKFDQFSKLIRKAAEYAADLLGFIIQSDKWDIHLGSYGKYCQYLVSVDTNKEVHAYYPASLILNSICNPEKQYSKSEWDKDYRDLDIIMKLSNGRELPYFHELIDYVDHGMKFRLLGQSDADARRILSKYDRYLELQSSSQEYNWYDSQENRGIMNNPVVQYLLSKRK